MGFFEIVMIAVGLSMDAFAVAVCKGLASVKISLKKILTVGAWFGFFQAFMSGAGYLLGQNFEVYIKRIDHWVAFVLLGIIGFNMIREAFGCDEEANDDMSFKTMLLFSLATSIDALAVGISFAFLPKQDVSVLTAVLLIGAITFLLSCIGFVIGNKFGARYKNRAEIVGGIILILMGTKILLEHLGIL